MDLYTIFFTVLMTLFMVGSVAVSLLLFGFAKESNFSLPALNERLFSSVVKAAGTAILVILGINRLFNWGWDDVVVLTLLSAGIFLSNLPPVLWVYYYVRGRFQRG